MKNIGYAARDKSGKFAPLDYETREPGADEIIVKVKYCGVCHSDIHTVKSEWGTPTYPIVTGHEFIGEIVKVGPFKQHDDPENYPEWKVGDVVGVGCLVDSCASCDQCKAHWENHCDKSVGTYDAVDHTGTPTFGGYGKYVVLNRRFAIRIPEHVNYVDAAPLLCAGITTYSPIKQHNMERGNLKIGVMGLGGLGHMALQYAAKINPTNTVIVFSRSTKKRDLAVKLGAKDCVATGNARKEDGEWKDLTSELKAQFGTFDYILDTVSAANKSLELYLSLLKPRGTWISVGLPPVKDKMCFPMMDLITANKALAGSCIGGIKETQEMINFSFANNIMPMVEHIKAEQINDAIERVIKGDVMFRFVIDVEESYRNF